MGLTHALPLWLLLRGAAGIASAWILVYAAAWALPLLSQWNRANWSGLLFSGVGAGIAVTGLACLLLAAHGTSSQTTWRLLGALALFLSLAVWGVLSDGGRTAQPSSTKTTGGRWSSSTWRLVICYGVFGFGYIIPATFLPVIARRTLHAPSVVGLFWPAFGLAAFLSTLLAAALSGRRRDRWLLGGSFALQALGEALIALSPTIAGTALCALFVGGTFMVITMEGLREARRIAGPDASRLMGAMTAAFAVGQILGPLYAGVLVKRSDSFTESLLTAALLMAVGAVALLWNGQATEGETTAKGSYCSEKVPP